MAIQVLSADNGDTFPVTGDPQTNEGRGTVFQYVNGLDVEATFTLYGTRDGDASGQNELVTLASSTVSAGSAGRDGLSEEWDVVIVEVDATSPTAGTAEAYQHSTRSTL